MMMMRTVFWTVCAVSMLGGCFVAPRDTPVGGVEGEPDGGGSGNPGGGYEYAGCANEDYNCSRLLTFYCAAEAVRLEHADGCTVDEDCTFAPVDDLCTGVATCRHPAVTLAQRAAFEAAFAREVSAYCRSNGGCHESPSCLGTRNDYRAACVAGTCQSVLKQQTISAPPPLPEALCEWTVPSAGGLCQDPGGCLVLHRDGTSPVVVLTRSALGDDVLHFIPLVTDSHLFFTTFRPVAKPVGPSRFVAMPALGGPMTDLLTLPAGTSFGSISAPAWDPAYGLWFTTDTTGASPERSVRVSPLLGGEPQVSSVAYPQITGPTSNGIAEGSNYLVAQADGLWEFYPAGGSRLVAAPDIVSIAAEGDHLVFSSCNSSGNGPCAVVAYSRSAGTTQTLIGPVDEDIRSLAIEGGAVYALSGRRLRRVPLSGGVVEVLYEGESFPQHSGTLAPRSLKVEGDRAYLGEICHRDADAPGYGTVELDLTAGTSRWLNADPAFPHVPHVVPFHGWEEPPLRNAHGFYVWQPPFP